MTSAPDDGGLAAALFKVSALSGQIGALDTREREHHKRTEGAIADVHVRLTAVRGTLRTQSAALESLKGLDQAVERLTEQLAAMEARERERAEGEYEPIPVVEWWRIKGTEGQEAVARVRAWVEDIYRPGYGHLAAGLGPCWPQHPLCLYLLDWLSELWSVIHLNAERTARTLATQAEFSVRILPAAADLLRTETGNCRRHGTYQTPGTARP